MFIKGCTIRAFGLSGHILELARSGDAVICRTLDGVRYQVPLRDAVDQIVRQNQASYPDDAPDSGVRATAEWVESGEPPSSVVPVR